MSWSVFMAVLLIVIFVGFLNQFRVMYFEDGEANDPDVGAVTPWMIAPMWLAIVPLLVMGLWWPQAFWDYFQTIALSLGGLASDGDAAMIGTRAQILSPDALQPAAEALLEDGRPGSVRLRLVAGRGRGRSALRLVGSGSARFRHVGREGRPRVAEPRGDFSARSAGTSGK